MVFNMSQMSEARGWRGGRLPRGLVLKVGSALLTPSGPLGERAFSKISAELSTLEAAGLELTLVSSGAIAQGRLSMNIAERPRELSTAQALAALGQPLLMQRWAEALSPQRAAQVLLTMSDVSDPLRFYNARCALRALRALGALPIGNENDTVATEEIRFGDNDRLGAHLARVTGAELLILYTQVDGLYTANPKRDSSAQRITLVEDLSEVRAFAGGSDDEWGTGGMKTKLDAADIAHQSGCSVIIAQGGTPLLELLRDPSLGTLIPAPRSVEQALLAQWPLCGRVELSDEAAQALRSGLAVELSACLSAHGEFTRGQLVEVSNAGESLGRALIGYGSVDCERASSAHHRSSGSGASSLSDGPLIHPQDWVAYLPHSAG